MIDETRYIPQYARPVTGGRKPLPGEAITDRKARFASILKYVTARQGWLTSVPGERDVEMQCLPGSSLPDELRAGAEYKLGDETVRLPPFKVTADGEGERILAHGIIQHFVADAEGEMVLRIEGDTRPICRIVTHAGITRVLKFSFKIP